MSYPVHDQEHRRDMYGYIRTREISIEEEEAGFVLIIENDGDRLTVNIQDVAEQLYDQARSRIGPWLRERDAMKPWPTSQVPETPFDDVPEPSDFDIENLSDILTGRLGDWFDAELFRLIRHADGSNLERLRMVYPLHVQAYEAYLKGES